MDDGRLEVTGLLGLRGVERELTCVVGRVGEGRDGPHQYRVGFECGFSLLRSDFGMRFGIPGVAGDEVRVTVSLIGVRPLRP